MGFKSGDYPIAEAYYGNAISIPMFHGMTHEQQDTVINTIRGVLHE